MNTIRHQKIINASNVKVFKLWDHQKQKPFLKFQIKYEFNPPRIPCPPENLFPEGKLENYLKRCENAESFLKEFGCPDCYLGMDLNIYCYCDGGEFGGGQNK